MIEVRMEKIPTSMSDKKTAGPTVGMVRQILSYLGQDGVWTLRVQKRIRKKTQERFKAIRIEYAGSYRTIKVCCKPGGNDTAWEYWLVPPQFADVQVAFDELCTIHPKTLRPMEQRDMSPGEFAILGSVIGRAMNMPADVVDKNIRVTRERMEKERGDKNGIVQQESDDKKKTAVIQESAAVIQESAAVIQEFKEPSELESSVCGGRLEIVDKSKPNGDDSVLAEYPVSDIASEVGRSESITRMFGERSLLISESEKDMLLSEPAILDKALLAISMIVKSSYASRVQISEAIVAELDIKNFVSMSSVYTCVESAMRALMMGLCGEGFLDRVTNSKGTLKGYKLTPKGERRISTLGGTEASKTKSEKELVPEMTQRHTEREPEPEPPHADLEFSDEYIHDLEAYVKELKSHNENTSAIKKLLEEARLQREDFAIHFNGIEAAINQKAKEREDLDADIKRLQSKKDELEQKIASKDEDIKACSEELDEFNRKRMELEKDSRRHRQ